MLPPFNKVAYGINIFNLLKANAIWLQQKNNFQKIKVL